MGKLTLSKLLSKEQDGVLLDIQQELFSELVPATSKAHSYCRKVNLMIDAGELCINPTTYRKVYLPTLAKAIQHEMTARYAKVLTGESISAEDRVKSHYIITLHNVHSGEVTVLKQSFRDIEDVVTYLETEHACVVDLSAMCAATNEDDYLYKINLVIVR